MNIEPAGHFRETRNEGMDVVTREPFRAAPEYRNRPAFLLTMDTEGDNLWSYPSEITTRNSQFLPRFQSLCERYGLKPTWLTNHEMACCPRYQEFARDVLKRGQGEIGMHLHAWNSPPVVPTPDSREAQPLLIAFPEPVIREKVKAITSLLENVFDRKMTSHRAGRWGFNATYARILVENGYTVDCSVTPHVAWHEGSDYTNFPEEAYFLNLQDISRPAAAGATTLLEVPVTIRRTSSAARMLNGVSRHLPPLARRAVAHVAPAITWLRPNGRNLKPLLKLLRQGVQEQQPYVEFILHSSELMPGGSPRFDTEAKIERLYDDLEQLFSEASRCYRGSTLSEYASSVAEAQPG